MLMKHRVLIVFPPNFNSRLHPKVVREQIEMVTMLKKLREIFPVGQLDSKTTHNALVVAEHKKTGLSRDQLGHLAFATVFTAMSAAILLVPDQAIGGSDAALIRLLMLPACVILACRQMLKFWHDWRNILYIDKRNNALCHFQMNRRGVKTGMLRIGFDDIQKVRFSGAKTDKGGKISDTAQLIVNYNREPGRLVALRGRPADILIAKDLVLEELKAQVAQNPAVASRQTNGPAKKIRIMLAKTLWSVHKLNPLN